MRTIIILIATIAIYSTAFYRPECEHVFTQVEQPVVKTTPSSIQGSSVFTVGYYSYGLQEGKELICVKCFHRQKQLLDYGQPIKTTGLSEWLRSGTSDTCLPNTIYYSISFDTSGVVTGGAAAVLK